MDILAVSVFLGIMCFIMIIIANKVNRRRIAKRRFRLFMGMNKGEEENNRAEECIRTYHDG